MNTPTTVAGTLPALPSDDEPDAEADSESAQSAPAQYTGGPRSDLLPPETESPWERYEDLGRIGRGGMGEVRRVFDRVMGRAVAMKLIHAEIGDHPVLRARFLAETRLTARLQHPGIVPVYDCGTLPDGSLWFTMKEVRGRTLRSVFAALHAGGGPSPSALWRAVEMFLRVCEAVAYAHEQGVIHRDLKPDNVMVGEFGEILVMDWGIGKAAQIADEPSIDAPSSDDPQTQAGQVLGTLDYMPPEQARGEVDRLGPPSDVYALGAMLYEMLCGAPPYNGSPLAVLAQILNDAPMPLWKRCGAAIPADLVALCERAMARDPADRPRTAGVLAGEMRGFLDGVRRRERALALCFEARAHAPKVEALRARARALREEARATLARFQLFDPAEQKASGWALEDEARELELTATQEEVARRQTLHAALIEDPELPEAHEDLADAHLGDLRAAELARDAQAAARAEALLRAHDRGRHAAILRGDGALTLVTEPAGAEVKLSRYVEARRRLVLEPAGSLGPSPLHRVTLQRGSYLLEVSAPGYHTMRYPVLIGRGEHWDGVRPGDGAPLPIPLLREGDLDEGDIYVPAGFFRSGGDPLADESLQGRRLWMDGFVIRRHPVTQAEYLVFLNDLVAQGRGAEAEAACPRAGGSIAGNMNVPLFVAGEDGRYAPGPHAPAEHGRHPIASVTWHAAVAYARWFSARAGRSYRLPGELEREKAARGADGRFLPWGDQLEPTWSCMASSRPGAPGSAPIDDYPTDESPYGARGLAGNVRDWCCEVWTPEGPPVKDGRLILLPASDGDPELRSIRGGTWGGAPTTCRSTCRLAAHPGQTFRAVGVRLARSIG